MATEGQSSQPPAEDHTSTPADENIENPQTQPPPSQPPPPQPSSSSQDGAEPGASAAGAPASPPLPSRHTAATPGPRAQRFQEMFGLALDHTLTKISPDNFASCYPTVASQAPAVLGQVQRAMVDRFADLCNQEFGRVQARYGVVPKLNELEALVSDAILAAHLAPHLASQQSQMNARLQNTQAANVALWGEIQGQRAEVDELLGALERALADVDGAAALLDEVPAEELARESRTVEAEMTDV